MQINRFALADDGIAFLCLRAPSGRTGAKLYPPEVTRLRVSVCIDGDCELSYGDAHAGSCTPCNCGEKHALVECDAFWTAWRRLAVEEVAKR